MISLSSLEVSRSPSARDRTYVLERTHADRTSLQAAVKAENRRLNRHCEGNRKRLIPGYHSTSRHVVLFCSDLACNMRVCATITPHNLTHCCDARGVGEEEESRSEVCRLETKKRGAERSVKNRGEKHTYIRTERATKAFLPLLLSLFLFTCLPSNLLRGVYG
jgi:hypothetical protein